MKTRVGIIGFGNMGRAFALCLYKSQKSVLVYDKDPKKYLGVKNISFSKDIKALLESCDVVIFAVKPKDFQGLLARFGEYLSARHLLISIAAGIPADFFNKFINKPRVIRAMPNLAANVNESVTFISKGRFANKKDLETARKIFLSAGEVIVAKESDLNKVTALSGSGPGYVFYFMDAIYKSALKMGFGQKDARKAVAQIFWGAAKLAKESKSGFDGLVKEVASKGGTTEAALKIFEKGKVKKTVEQALKAAWNRAERIAK